MTYGLWVLQVDNQEVSAPVWLSAGDALKAAEQGGITLPPPTTYILTELELLFNNLNFNLNEDSEEFMKQLSDESRQRSLCPYLPTLYFISQPPDIDTCSENQDHDTTNDRNQGGQNMNKAGKNDSKKPKKVAVTLPGDELWDMEGNLTEIQSLESLSSSPSTCLHDHDRSHDHTLDNTQHQKDSINNACTEKNENMCTDTSGSSQVGRVVTRLQQLHKTGVASGAVHRVIGHVPLGPFQVHDNRADDNVNGCSRSLSNTAHGDSGDTSIRIASELPPGTGQI